MIKAKKINSPAFLSGGGEMGERIRNFDWKNTSLGVPENWPAALQNLLSLMLANRFPMILWWGSDYIQFYNDAYLPLPGLKHPDLLGKTAKDCWQEIWHVIGPLIDTPYNGGEPTWMDDIQLQIYRNNFTEETHFTIAYSPVPDGTALNGIGGVLATVHEITNQIINQRALETLQKISSYSLASNSVNTVYENALLALSENKKDFTFAIIYKIDEAGNTAQLCATTGIDKTHPEIERFDSIDLTNTNANTENMAKAVAENTIVHSVNDGRWRDLPKGDWDIMPNEFVHVPVKNLNKKYPHAILTIGLNPYRKFDDSYRNFVKLVSEQISQGVNNALAYETERKRVEVMEELDKAKTVFFSNISHEFRTPLTLILGPLEALLAKAPVNFKEEDMQHLETTHRNAMRLLRLVNSLLDFSRIESGKQQGAFVLTDISEYTIKLSSNFRSLIEKAGLKFMVNADAVIQPVYVDRQMWEKIIFNLLSNAFKYTLKGQITVSLSSKNNFAVLKIKDTGVGIPQNELPKMFDRFHRVANTAGRTYEGTGIGLSLVKELVNLHGGSINVESKEGKGSTFTVTIPFGKAHLPETKIKESEDVYADSIAETYAAEFATLLNTNAASQKTNGEQTSLSNELVLIVDDNADMRQHLQSLIGAKYKTMLAVNGMDALDKINEHKPSVVLSDIMMPVMDGVQLLKEIKKNSATQNIPVIMLTARAGEESKIEGYQTGADDYLIKPFSSKELIARIDSQIKTKKQREDARKKSEQSDTNIRNFVNHAPVAICVLRGPDYIVEVANEKMLEIWGRTAEQMLNKPVFEAMPDAADQGLEELLNEVYKTGKPFIANELPVNLIRNGVPELVFLNFVYEPLYGYDKTISSIVAVATEVTEQINARKKIEQSEKILHNFFMHTPALMHILRGPEHIFGLANSEYQKFIGNRNPTGKKLLEAMPELAEQNFINILDNVYKTGESFSGNEMPVFLTMENGQLAERYVNVNYIPFDNAQEQRDILAFAYDVTEQINARKKIEQSEKELQRLFEQAPAAIVILTGPQHVFTLVNPHYEIMVGRTKEQLLGKSFREAFPEVDGQGIYEMYDNLFQKGEGIRHTPLPVTLKKEGKLVNVFYDVSVEPINDADGKTNSLLVVGYDITEQTENRKKIEESEKQLRKELADTHELQKISTHLFHEDNADEIYQQILEVAMKLMGAEFASIQVYDSLTEQLLLLANKNFHPHSEKFWQIVNVRSGTPCGEALKTNQRIIITDLEINAITNTDAEELKSYRLSGIRSVQSTPLLSREGSLIGMVSTHWKKVHEPSIRDLNLMDVLARQATDIIVQKKVDAKLKQSEEQFRVMANSIPQLAWMTDEKGSVQWYNQRWYDYTGTTFEEMQGWGWQKVHHPDTVDSMVKKLKTAFENHSFWEDEFPLRSKSGEFRWFLSRAYPIKNDDGTLRGWFGTNTDITQQREATKKIKESEERFRSLAQSLPQLVWITDGQGNAEFASFRWKEYSGVEPGGEKEWKAIVHPDDYDGINAAWSNSLTTGNIYKFDVRLKSKVGEYRWHTVKGEPVLDKENKIVKWVGAFTDIHEQKIREEKKDEFISIASHEMKTPLTTAKAYLQMLELSLDEQNEDANLYAKKASQSVNRLNELVGELLDASKIRLGKLNYNIATFDFNDMINTIVENIQLTSPTHTILKTGKVYDEVTGDKDRLQQVVINLLNNAIKYSPGADKVVILIEQHKDTIQVSVKDTGIGIAQQSLDKIFDKYHRVEEHAIHFQGLGIGLFISYEIIQRHHGKLWAESEAGAGSTFYFTIPLNFTATE